jgi:hypothetical protein
VRDREVFVGFGEQVAARVAVAERFAEIEVFAVVPPLLVAGSGVDPDDVLDSFHAAAPVEKPTRPVKGGSGNEVNGSGGP